MNNLQVYNNEEFGAVRVTMIDGEPWFVGRDVATILGYSNQRDALARHVDDEDKGVAKHDTLGGSQDLVVINESGLYSLVLRSKLDNAKKFKRWVTKEVLPAIRKTGGYVANDDLFVETHFGNLSDEQKAILKISLDNNRKQQAKIKELETKVEEDAPKVEYHDNVLQSKSTFNISQIAFEFGISGVRLNKILHEQHIQYKQGGQWLLYEEHKGKGYTEVVTVTYPDGDGFGTNHRTKWTETGRKFIHEVMIELGYKVVNELVEVEE